MVDHVEQIKSRLDVVDVISGYLKLQKSGVNFKARCPFHNEKSGSFFVSPERQIWHCFGCSKGGDMFGFIKEIEGVEFPEALRTLAARAGVQLERTDPAVRDRRSKLLEICEISTKFFEKQLWFSDAGKKALAYLRERGLTDETIKEFRLGFAPNDWQSLGNFLSERGYNHQEIVDAGMAVKSEGRQYDRFRSRIVFPIADLNKNIVGFTARIFSAEGGPASGGGNEGAKYINSPQTNIYDKSRILYGLAHGKTDIRRADHCLLVEGNMDVLMSYQAGVRNVVATSGTALTPQQLRLLDRYTKKLKFCFDSDQAGAAATRRGIGLALADDFDITIVQIKDPDCKDPADYVKKYGVEWEKVVAQSQPVIEFYIDKVRTTTSIQSLEGKKSLIATVAPLIKRLTGQVEKTHWIRTIAQLLRAPEEAVQADIATAKDDLAVYDERAQADEPVKAKIEARIALELDPLSENLLAVIFKNPSVFMPDITQLDLSTLPPYAKMVCEHLAKAEQPAKVSIDSLVKIIGKDDAYPIEVAYLKSQELRKDFSDKELREEFDGIVRNVKTLTIKKSLALLALDIQAAEAEHDSEKSKILAGQYNQTLQALSQLQNFK